MSLQSGRGGGEGTMFPEGNAMSFHEIGAEESFYQDFVRDLTMYVESFDLSQVKVADVSPLRVFILGEVVGDKGGSIMDFPLGAPRCLREPRHIIFEFPVVPDDDFPLETSKKVEVNILEWGKTLEHFCYDTDKFDSEKQNVLRDYLKDDIQSAFKKKYFEEGEDEDKTIDISPEFLTKFFDIVWKTFQFQQEQKTPGNYEDKKRDVLWKAIQELVSTLDKNNIGLVKGSEETFQTVDTIVVEPELSQRDRNPQKVVFGFGRGSYSSTLTPYDYIPQSRISDGDKYLNNFFDELWTDICRIQVGKENDRERNDFVKGYNQLLETSLENFSQYLKKRGIVVGVEDIEKLFTILFYMWQADIKEPIIYEPLTEKEKEKVPLQNIFYHYAVHHRIQPGVITNFFAEKSVTTRRVNQRLKDGMQSSFTINEDLENLLRVRNEAYFFTKEEDTQNFGKVSFDISVLWKWGFEIYEASNSSADEIYKGRDEGEKYFHSFRKIQDVEDCLKYKKEERFSSHESMPGDQVDISYVPFCPEYLVTPPSVFVLRQLIDQKKEALEQLLRRFKVTSVNLIHCLDVENRSDRGIQDISINRLDLEKPEDYQFLVNILFNSAIIDIKSGQIGQSSGASFL